MFQVVASVDTPSGGFGPKADYPSARVDDYPRRGGRFTAAR
jgi:hypothetical protein